MPANQALEDRVDALEKAVDEIRRRFAVPATDENWMDQFKGAFRDDPDFAEVIRLGREFRYADLAQVPGLSIEDWTV